MLCNNYMKTAKHMHPSSHEQHPQQPLMRARATRSNPNTLHTQLIMFPFQGIYMRVRERVRVRSSVCVCVCSCRGARCMLARYECVRSCACAALTWESSAYVERCFMPAFAAYTYTHARTRHTHAPTHTHTPTDRLGARL